MDSRILSAARFLLRTLTAVAAAIHTLSTDALSHPMHSEAIERPCEIRQTGGETPLVQGRCSFFVAADYLVFKLDSAPSAGARPQNFSGAINLAQATGSVFAVGGAHLADGTVKLAGRSTQVVDMKPGALAEWENGYVLQVGGNPVTAGGPVAAAGYESDETIFYLFAAFLKRGFVHIIPRGLDHILFVVGLFLLSRNIGALLWQVSAFTLAHTVTLALGTTGIVRLPAEVVEPLIAFSIVWVALENLTTDRLNRWRIGVVFCFGLMHGFGFAGVLRDIGLSGPQFFSALLAFNMGVELGQLAVVGICFLIFGWAMNRTFYYGRVVVPASCAIAVIASYWVLDRTLLA